MLRQTHTFVTLPISPAAFQEIKKKLEEADYKHTFNYDYITKELTIDMHGIGLVEEK